MKTELVSTTYKGLSLILNEDENIWEIQGIVNFSDSSLKQFKKYIDKIFIEGFNNFEAYLLRRHCYEDNLFKLVTVVSIKEDEKIVWVITKEGNLFKENIDCIFSLTSENAKIIAEYQKILNEEKAIIKRKEEILFSLQKLVDKGV